MNKCNSNIILSSRNYENEDARQLPRRLLPSLNTNYNWPYPSVPHLPYNRTHMNDSTSASGAPNTRRTVSAGAVLTNSPFNFGSPSAFNNPPPPVFRPWTQMSPPNFLRGPPPPSQFHSTLSSPANSMEMMMMMNRDGRPDSFPLFPPQYIPPYNNPMPYEPRFLHEPMIPMRHELRMHDPMRHVAAASAPDYSDEDQWRGVPIQDLMGAYVTSKGFISFRLRKNICLDITIDKAIRLINYTSKSVISLSADGEVAAFIHPSGCVYQYCGTKCEDTDPKVEVSTTEQFGPLKYAKISNKGISFTATNHSLTYMVDAAGTRSTSDIFSDLTGDFALPTFLNGSTHDTMAVSEALRILQTAQYWSNRNGTENWIINGIRIVQEPDGHVRVARDLLRYQLRTNPTNGNGSISTPVLHCTASVGGHLFIKRGSKRIHFDGKSFMARNGSHSSGFDSQSQLKLFG